MFGNEVCVEMHGTSFRLLLVIIRNGFEKFKKLVFERKRRKHEKKIFKRAKNTIKQTNAPDFF